MVVICLIVFHDEKLITNEFLYGVILSTCLFVMLAKAQLKYKPVEHVELKHDECIVCREQYNHNDRIAQCHLCHQQLHLTCFLHWCSEIEYSSPMCPFCRTPWHRTQIIYYPVSPLIAVNNDNP